MATQLLSPVQRPARTEAYWDLSQALSGVLLILFMWSHMILVASVNLGTGVMNAIAELLERYYLAQLGGPMIGLLFLAHFVLAARKLPFRIREQKAIWIHSVRFNHLDTWLWVVQAVTAMVILIIGIGFYRIGVKWGWITRANRQALKGFENKLTLAFIAIGLITLLNFYFLVKISD